MVNILLKSAVIMILLKGWTCVIATDAPTGMAKPYINSMDPQSANGFADTLDRPAAFWSLKKSATDTYTAGVPTVTGRTAPPDGVLFSSTSVVTGTEAGIHAHALTTSGPDTTDTTVRFTGADNSCLKMSGFTSSFDVCLASPSECSLVESTTVPKKGLSMSFWVHLPQTLTTTKHYLIDTGGDELGSPGIAVYFVGSGDGVAFTQQITVLVSTGPEYWKVVLNGMTRAYAWNNIGFTWSAYAATDAAPLGLRVYVNGTSTAWKTYGVASTDTAAKTVPLADVVMTVGCNRAGTNSFNGRMDNLIVWYWAFGDADAKGATGYLMGGMTFDLTNQILLTGELGAAPSGGDALMADGWQPPDFTIKEAEVKVEAMKDNTYIDDFTAAIEGDCSTNNPSGWGAGGPNGKPHPIDCADTVNELKAALTMDDNWTGYEAVIAIIRVVNKAPGGTLDIAGIDYVFGTALGMAVTNVTAPVDDYQAMTYMNIIHAISRLQEPMYDTLWQDQLAAKKPGLSKPLQSVNTLLDKLSLSMVAKRSVDTSCNNTAARAWTYVASDVTSNVQYIDTGLKRTVNDLTTLFYNFSTVQKDHWGLLRDTITLPSALVKSGYTDQTTSVGIVAQVYNRIGIGLSGTVATTVTGLPNPMMINGRVLSMSLQPALSNTDALAANPITFVIAHIEEQIDAPNRKAAVLCVYWKYDSTASYGGGWDSFGCKVSVTNDTHTQCSCAHMSDYTVLMEKDYDSSSRFPEAIYIILWVLLLIGIIMLIVFLVIIVKAERLHYELHVMQWNAALALLLALVFYAALPTVTDRMACMTVGVAMDYCYLCTHLWLILVAVYCLKASKAGDISDRHFVYYIIAGWGVPALIIILFICIGVDQFGATDRCFGRPNGYFLWILTIVAILSAIAITAASAAAFAMSGSSIVQDQIDKKDIKMATIIPIVLGVILLIMWLLVMIVYLLATGIQALDFMFEFLNCLLPYIMVIGWMLTVPSCRITVKSKGKEPIRIRGDPSTPSTATPQLSPTPPSSVDTPLPKKPKPADVDAVLRGTQRKKEAADLDATDWQIARPEDPTDRSRLRY